MAAAIPGVKIIPENLVRLANWTVWESCVHK